MAKYAVTGGKIEIRNGGDWVDISNEVGAWRLIAEMEAPYFVELDLHINPAKVQLKARWMDPTVDAKMITMDDHIIVHGVDISDHVSRYRIDHKVGDLAIITVTLIADRDMLRINGGAPWEFPEFEVKEDTEGQAWIENHAKQQAQEVFDELTKQLDN